MNKDLKISKLFKDLVPHAKRKAISAPGFSLNWMGASHHQSSFYFLNPYDYLHFDQVMTYASAVSLQHVDAIEPPFLFWASCYTGDQASKHV